MLMYVNSQCCQCVGKSKELLVENKVKVKLLLLMVAAFGLIMLILNQRETITVSL